MITTAVRRLSSFRVQNTACSVFISQSKDVFANLALEDWLYRNFDFNNHRVLLLWRNTPCVVIGRHQNPWIEANINYLRDEGIALARRNSGGGTVYHDMGNLNCTFFTPRSQYNRKNNLQLIADALSKEFDLSLEITEREDITLNGKKVSGTAAKLGKNAYHHCTVLVEADRGRISTALNVDNSHYITNATESIRSPVTSLKSLVPSITVDDVMEAVGDKFLDGFEAKFSRGYALVNPSDGWFPGIREIKRSLQTWEWNFGKTPRFCVRHDINFPEGKLHVKVSVINGVISKIEMDGNSKVVNRLRLEGVASLQGQRYCCNMTSLIQERLMSGDTISATICGQEQTFNDNLDDVLRGFNDDDIKLYLRI